MPPRPRSATSRYRPAMIDPVANRRESPRVATPGVVAPSVSSSSGLDGISGLYRRHVRTGQRGPSSKEIMRSAHSTGVWRLVWVERLVQDVRYGSRMMAANPAFAAVAIASLAIGIGATCAIFSFADALLLRPLPVARPSEVVTVGSTASLEAL